jgi:hypothetical protein
MQPAREYEIEGTCVPVCLVQEMGGSMFKFLMLCLPSLAFCVVALTQSPCSGFAQAAQSSQGQQESADDQQIPPAILKQLDTMRARIEQLEAELNQLKTREEPTAASGFQPGAAGHARSTPPRLSEAPTPAAPAAQAAMDSSKGADFPGLPSGTTLNFNLDGYYGYNFNRPVGRVNLLRAYDVISNSFSLNQVGIILERAPDLEDGRRWGGRLDLMFGQATETLQGGAQNETRPQVYRNVFQAYGSYVFAVGSGLTMDFGKWASSLGYENNYTKDQLNYSRSYFFNFLPFYHFGFRTKYALNDRVTVMYHLINGTNQSEDVNGFKSQHFAVILTPAKTVTWQVNYYFGREQRDLVPLLNPGIPVLPTQAGLSTTPIVPPPDGREHIFDTYANWNATNKLTLAAEADDVVSRGFSNSAPARVTGGVGYMKYQLWPSFSLAGRFEYLSDRGGLFSGATQALKEGTLTATYQFAEGFQMRGEFRRDFSNQPFFLSNVPGSLKRDQDSVTLGLIWWWGSKQGAW